MVTGFLLYPYLHVSRPCNGQISLSLLVRISSRSCMSFGCEYTMEYSVLCYQPLLPNTGRLLTHRNTGYWDIRKTKQRSSMDRDVRRGITDWCVPCKWKTRELTARRTYCYWLGRHVGTKPPIALTRHLVSQQWRRPINTNVHPRFMTLWYGVACLCLTRLYTDRLSALLSDTTNASNLWQ